MKYLTTFTILTLGLVLIYNSNYNWYQKLIIYDWELYI